MTQKIKLVALSCAILFGGSVINAQENVKANESKGKWILKGKVDNNILKHHILQNLSANGVKYIDSISVLEYTQKKPWAIVKLAIASHRTGGKHAAEMATQTIMGTPVKILEYSGDWARVQTPDEYNRELQNLQYHIYYCKSQIHPLHRMHRY